jgi:RHS repeat-associated protein
VTVERLMSWGADNRLRWVSAGGATTSYRYDADGQRIAKSGPGGTTHYFGNLFEVEDPQGAARLVKYYYAGGLLLARQESGTKFWYHPDHLGSVRAMSDGSGASTVAYEYAAFGDTIGTTGSADNLRGYGAHWRDDESHLVYMGARYQDPVLGRFTQPDTLVPDPGDPQSWNRYSYVRNNPVNRIDPTGNADWDAGAYLGGEVVGYLGGNQAAGSFFGSLLAGLVPGPGEVADFGVLTDPNEGVLAQTVAGLSLAANVVVPVLPNVGPLLRAGDEALDAAGGVLRQGDEVVEVTADAKRVAKQREARAERRERRSRQGKDGAKDPGGKPQKQSGEGYRDHESANRGPTGERPTGPDRRHNRERNIGIDEEHSRVPKGGFRPR